MLSNFSRCLQRNLEYLPNASFAGGVRTTNGNTGLNTTAFVQTAGSSTQGLQISDRKLLISSWRGTAVQRCLGDYLLDFEWKRQVFQLRSGGAECLVQR